MRLPDGVLGMARRGPDWARWVESLPGLVRDLLVEWELTTDGWMQHGYTALIVPVRRDDDGRAMLKLSFPDEETEHEHLALTHWAGRGAVRLDRADPRRHALLLPRLGERDLTDLPALEACGVVASLYADLHVPAPPQLRPVTVSVARSAEALARLPRSAPIPHRLVEQAISLSHQFLADPGSVGTLVHADLHYRNVLDNPSGQGGKAWLAIDPKPMSGDPHYELAPMLWNRVDELAGSVREGIRSRFHCLVDTGELDEDRARDWVVVRMLNQALWHLDEVSDGAAERLDQQWVTTCVAVAKAVQD